MDESKLALERELGQLFGQCLGTGSADDAFLTLEREEVRTCGHCGAWVRLMGVPPETSPDQPKIALYYPDQFCPNCGNVVGRGLDIELFPSPGIPGAPVYYKITCPECKSHLEYMTQALPPQYLEELFCPVCGISLGVEGQTVETLERAPWPVGVAEEPKPYRATIIVGGVVAAIAVVAGITHHITKKPRR